MIGPGDEEKEQGDDDNEEIINVDESDIEIINIPPKPTPPRQSLPIMQEQIVIKNKPVQLIVFTDPKKGTLPRG